MPADSMNIGISGLDAYQAQIDVISNNIANVGTTGYKGQSLSFQDLLYQTQQPGSGPTKTSGGINYQQVGIGVKVGGTDTDMTQGGVQTTGVTTNMMINGDGYFIMKNADGTGTPKYTRNGDFSLSSSGLLFDPSSGNAVMGNLADSTGKIVSGTPGPITVPIGLKSLATATGTGVKGGPTGDKVFDMGWGGNLDSTQYSASVAALATATAAPAVTAAAAAAALVTSNTTAIAASTALNQSITDASSASSFLAAANAAALNAAVPTATAATVSAAAISAATNAATAASTASSNAIAAAAVTLPPATVASVVLAANTVVGTTAGALNGATINTVLAAVAAASAGAGSALTAITAAATTIPSSTPASVLAAVGAVNTTAISTAAASLAVSASATAAASNALAQYTAAQSTAATTALNTTPITIAAAFAAASTPDSAGTTIYDSLGNPHLMNVSFTPANLGAAMPLQVNDATGTAQTAATAWTYTLTSTDGTLFSNGTQTSPAQYAFFDQGGQFINSSGTINPLSTTVHTAGSLPSLTAGNQLAVTQWGTPVGANNSSSVVVPAKPGPIGVDLSKMSANGSAAQVLAVYQNGFAPGTLDNMTVGADGTITGSYTNGQALAIGQVALATFQNESGLLRAGGSNYVQSVDSGDAQVGVADAGRFGSITGNSLELSNVSIGDEFTKLITAQNAFTANSKSITTANSDDQTVINLIH